jgi:Bromodomain
MNVPDVPENVTIYDHWERAAKRMINNLWKAEGAHIFHAKVDWVAWNLLDYPTIIKNPIDFSIIKEKLQGYQYKSIHEFLEDVQLVFNNCILYNGD